MGIYPQQTSCFDKGRFQGEQIRVKENFNKGRLVPPVSFEQEMKLSIEMRIFICKDPHPPAPAITA